MQNKQKAIFLMVISVFALSVMQLVVKLSGANLPTMQQVFARNFVTLIISAVMMLKSEGKISLGPVKHQPALLCRSILGYIGVYGYFYASRNMIAADATLLHRSSPFFVIIFSAIFLKQAITKVQVFALLLSAVGAVFVINPQMNSDIFPALIGLLSAVGAGGAYTTINYLKGKVNNAAIVFHFSLTSCVLSLLLGGKDFIMPDVRGWLMLLGIGIFAGIGQMTLTSAYKLTNPGDVSILNYLGIIFSAVFGYLFLGETMKLNGIIGMIMIFAAALWIFFSARKEKKAKAAA